MTTPADLAYVRHVAESCRCRSCRDCAAELLRLHAQGLDLAPGIPHLRVARAACTTHPAPMLRLCDRDHDTREESIR